MKWNPTDVACDIARLSDFLYKRHIFLMYLNIQKQERKNIF